MTLRQGLENFQIQHKDHLSHNSLSISVEARRFFLSHDIAHVLFGCDISLLGEGTVKLWTIFGTTLGFWNHIKAYNKANAYELSKTYNFVHVANNIFKLLFAIPVVIYRAMRMTKRWPWHKFEPYLYVPISEIRKEFNIKIVS